MRKHIIRLFTLGLALHLSAYAAEPANNKQQSAPKAKPPVAKSADKAQTTQRAVPDTAHAMQASEVAPEQARVVVAEQVHTGRMPCELGNFVSVTADPKNAGAFVVQIKQHKYHMVPVVSSTGAIRLEDAQAGAMWLQLANKSMLMNSKLGQRMADECQSPQQAAVAQAMKLAPPPNLLEGPAVANK
ncbi:MAG: hypothetical protein EB125_04490 [Betaproteobacteria bacterium]|nr:hypothetical protein [Betaproteobacteria bacterium]